MNKSNHPKMIDRRFLSKCFQKTLQKKLIFGKIAVGKEQPVASIKNSFLGTFHWKTNTKNRNFCCISQRTEAVIVNVKHKFYLKSRKKACAH